MRNITIILILLILGSACTDLSEYDKKRVNKALTDTLTSKTESWNVNMNLIQGGQDLVLLTSPYAETYSKKNDTETHFKGPVHISIKDSTGHVRTTVQCNKAVYLSKNSEFDFSGDVVIRTNKNKTLRSEFLKWLQQTKDISTPSYVTITTPTDSIAGYGLKGKEDLSTYTIKKVTGRVSIK